MRESSPAGLARIHEFLLSPSNVLHRPATSDDATRHASEEKDYSPKIRQTTLTAFRSHDTSPGTADMACKVYQVPAISVAKTTGAQKNITCGPEHQTRRARKNR